MLARRTLLILILPFLSCGDSAVVGPTADISGYSDGLPANVHRIFTTSQQYSPNFGGLSAMDTLCNTVARTAGLTRPYRAIAASTTASLASRFSSSAQVQIYNASVGFEILANSLIVAVTGGSTLVRSAALDQNGNSTTSGVWTCANQVDCCNDWTDGTASRNSVVGLATTTGMNWLNFVGTNCDASSPRRVFCVSAVGTESAWSF